MINIVHPFFCGAGCACNTCGRSARSLAVAALGCILTVVAPGASVLAHPLGHAAAAEPVSKITIPCLYGLLCEERPFPGRPPGPADRDVRPFDRTLGRPCAYRPRFTPSGTSRVRVCF